MTQTAADVTNMATGSVSKFKDGWQIRGRFPSGKQFRRTKTITGKPFTRATADRELRTLLSEIERTGVEPHSSPFKAWAEIWLAEKKGYVAESTYDSYRHLLSHVGEGFADVPLQKIDEDLIRSVYRPLSEHLASKTLSMLHSVLKDCFDMAVRERKMVFNPVRNVRLPKGKPPKDRVTWTLEEVSSFLDGVRLREDYILWLLFCTTGIRKGEACGLLWSNVDLEDGTIRIRTQRTRVGGRLFDKDITKTKAGRREIPLDPRVVSALRAWRASQNQKKLSAKVWNGGDFVVTFRNKPLDPQLVNKRFSKIIEELSLPKTNVHGLRHTFATLAIAQGMDVKLLSQILGHSKVTLTYDLYVHPQADYTRQSAAAVTAAILR